ncbi:MAG: Uma2 family endonuclease [Acidobacteria bacterium]|nr:Uma2 family endonuclease [Acidobacteriota bacterium]
MQQKTLLTLEQFFAMPDDGHDYELVHGELVLMPPQDFEHESAKSEVTVALAFFLQNRRHLGWVYPETGAILDEDSWRKPDVCFIRQERLVKLGPKSRIEKAPDLCVEVVSPSNSQRQIAEKVRHYRSTGATAVWVLYPNSQEIHVITKDRDQWLGPEDSLEQPDLLPGFSVPVKSLFRMPGA